jgi:hypothetical protein
MKTFTSAIIAGLAANAAAHGIVTKITIGTKVYQGYDPSFQYQTPAPQVIGWSSPQSQDRGPVPGTQYGSPDIICARGATPGAISAPVAAGESVSLQWTEWPASHKGPVLDYLANCNGDCSSVDKTALRFFKIDGVGMTGTSGSPPRFADDDMIANNNTWTVKIPSDIAPGNYVLRHETIALHEGNRDGGSQPYPQCINLQITGSGTANPPGVAGTQLYKQSDAGILFNIYRTFTSTDEYPVPGPPVYNGAGGGSTPPANGGGAAPAPSTPSITTRVGVAVPSATAAPVSQAPAPVPSGKGKNCRVKRWHVRDFAL